MVSVLIGIFLILISMTSDVHIRRHQDPYFPHGIVDLRYAISCDQIHEREIKLRTAQKTITLYADSVPSRDEWVKAIRKVIFKAQNMGESVKVGIPFLIYALFVSPQPSDIRSPSRIPQSWTSRSPRPWTLPKPLK